MKNHDTKQTQTSSPKQSWNRNEVACKIMDFEKAKPTQSQREFAQQHAVSRTTLQSWLSRKESLDSCAELIDFFESPVGNAFIHRLLVSAHYEFNKKGTASIHNISNFIKLIGLDPFVASSYTTQNRVSNKMDGKIIEFGEIEGGKMSFDMPKKKISLAEDETFHPDICLVAIEPASNYIIVEKYADNRTADTWDSTIEEALKCLNVEVFQVTSDEAKALIKHTCKGLEAHHSPDCFHVIQEIGKGTSAPLSSKIKQAEKMHDSAVKETQQEIATKDKYESMSPRPVGRRPDFDKRIAIASEKESTAHEKYEQALENQETVATAKADIGQVYHPYNLETGEKQDEEQVSGLLGCCFGRIYARIIDLSVKCKNKVDKAHRVVNSMVATIAFYFHMIELHMDNQKISARDREVMHNYLIPGFYLQEAASKEKDKKKKAAMLKKSQKLLAILSDTNGCLSDYSSDHIAMLITNSKECVTYFQRSSSCVEGRNAQLSLRHHGRHRLSETHLKAQTVLHNYSIKNSDGTTPAERFFETKHNDLFEWLLDNMDFPARPRKRFARAA